MNILKSIALALTIITASSCNKAHDKTPVEETSGKEINTLNQKQMNVLFVLTSHDQLGNSGKKTGFWVEEFASPYYILLDKGVNITIATPKGGAAPIDPSSDTPDAATEATKRFDNDEIAKEKIANTKVLADMNPDDFDAVFYPGGHGPLWDLANNETSISLIEEFNKQEKPIGFVCHAPAALKNVKGINGNPLVRNKKVTGFSNTEEKAVGLTDIVPFLVENMLTENGGEYSKKENWEAYAVQDGNLITGQNPASSELVAEKLLESLN
ncbi:type 1 glutamine amidotransferase domain-containing protein [Bizionia sp. KMM 8389]